MNYKRSAGVLLHITSLPTDYGVGTLGKEAYDFVDWLQKSGMKIWQVLPLVPTNYGDSPYQSVSSTALNYYLLDFSILKEKGLLLTEDYRSCELISYQDRVDFNFLFEYKIKILKKAFERFDSESLEFKNFIAKGTYHDFAIFMTIKALHNYKPWTKWEKDYQNYSKELDDSIVKNYLADYLFWQWTQFEFLNQWQSLHKYATEKGVQIMGDMPLYVAYDSVEVWKSPQMFLLNPDKSLKLVAGCPPDAFTDDGQLWGNPIYDWEYMKKNNYKWWNERISKAFELYDILRIDHFRGFDRYYAIPANHVNARHGHWEEGPKFDLFKDKTNLNIVAEDLGFIDEGVRKLMAQTKYPGMKVLEFAFDGNPYNEHKPSNYTENFVVYTGTHDNMPLYQFICDLSEQPLATFIKDLASECQKLNVKAKFNTFQNIVATVVELAFASKASMCIIPMQDLLCQDGYFRMNFPSTVSTANWSYRISSQDLSDALAIRLLKYSKKYSR